MISKKQVPRISSEQVEHIAKLARIELTEKEKEKFTNELSSILDYVEKLNEVDTKNIESIQQITGLNNITRSDIEIRNPKSEIRNNILNEASSKKDNYFKVPKILE
jgi:aspartyl-tRNA(Asn)/glutamyl-tRNA(Gln) amidotransferase subunit C